MNLTLCRIATGHQVWRHRAKAVVALNDCVILCVGLGQRAEDEVEALAGAVIEVGVVWLRIHNGE